MVSIGENQIWFVVTLGLLVLAVAVAGKWMPKKTEGPGPDAPEEQEVEKEFRAATGFLPERVITSFSLLDYYSQNRLLLDCFVELAPVTQRHLLKVLPEIGYLSRLRSALLKGRAEERAQATQVLGILQLPETIPDLLDALSDKVDEVRLTAASALASIRDERVVPLLIEALRHPERWLPARVAEVLVAQGSTAFDGILAALEKETEVSTKSLLIEILGEIGDPQAIPHLLPLLVAPWWEVRSKAAQALGCIGATEAYPHLIKALGDDVWQVRAHVAKALGKLGLPEALPQLEEAKKDAEWQVSANAEEAIRMLIKKTSPEGQDTRRTTHGLDGGG